MTCLRCGRLTGRAVLCATCTFDQLAYEGSLNRALTEPEHGGPITEAECEERAVGGP